VLEEFRLRERRAQAALSGQAPQGPQTLAAASAAFGPGPVSAPGVGGAGWGFGVPLGGLPAFGGVVPVGDPWKSDIPGYGIYLDSRSSATSPDDLTNAILFAAGGLGSIGVDGVKALGTEALGTVSRGLTLDGGRAIAADAERNALADAIKQEARHSESFVNAIQRGTARARITGQLAAGEARSNTVRMAIDAAGRVLPIPQGAAEVAQSVYRFHQELRYAALFRVLDVASRIEAHGPAGGAAAGAIRRALGVPG